MKTFLASIVAAAILSSCAWIGKPEPTPAGGILTTTETTEIYVGPRGSAWTHQLRYVLDDDASAPMGPWTKDNAPLARVRLAVEKPAE
jgi:hypothetical protein